MKNILIEVDDETWLKLNAKKGMMTWKEAMLQWSGIDV